MLMILANLQRKNWFGLNKLGLISYPLYLWHWPIISLLYIYIGGQPNTQLLLMAILISLVLSYLTYRYIEPTRYKRSSVITPILLLLAVLIAITGKYIDWQEGLPKRPHLNYLKSYDFEFKRTAQKNKACEAYVNNVLGEKGIFTYCLANINNNAKKIAIIGDSHAHVMYPGIANLAQKHGFDIILLANSSCPPLLGFEWGRNPQEKKKCIKAKSQIMRILQADNQIETVIMTTRGPVYIHGEVEGKFTENSVNASLNHFKNSKLTYASYQNGFKKTLENLKNSSHIKRVFYYFENPELDFKPKSIIPRPFSIPGLNPLYYAVDEKLYRQRMRKYKNVITSLANQYQFLTLIDTGEFLCNYMKCQVFIGTHSLYADDDHFSVFGSNVIAAKTEHILFSE